MTRWVSRRHLLTAAALLATPTATRRALGASAHRAAHRTRHASGDIEEFSPVRHGFGFRNWSTRTQRFDPPPDPTKREIGELIKTGWRDSAQDIIGLDTRSLAQPLVDAISLRLRIALSQRAGTNGHCYGMVLAAQKYYEDPDIIPVDRALARDIDHPAVPLDDPDAPVYDDILRLQTTQFLRFRAWLARRAMLYPHRIDARAVLDDITAVIDTFGTAAVTVFSEARAGHQLLAYRIDETPDGVSLRVYEPNTTANGHRLSPVELRFESVNGSLRMTPYRQYTHLLFNRFDRIEQTGVRDTATPLDHLTLNAAEIAASLFPFALVLADTSNVTLDVLTPSGEPVHRLSSPEMDRFRDEYPRVRSLHGTQPGTYHVSVYAHEPTDYTVRTIVADPDGAIVDESRVDTIDAGQRHTYTLEIPRTGSGSFQPTASDRWRPVVFGAAGMAAGAAGYWVYDRHITRKPDPPE